MVLISTNENVTLKGDKVFNQRKVFFLPSFTRGAFHPILFMITYSQSPVP